MTFVPKIKQWQWNQGTFFILSCISAFTSCSPYYKFVT